MCWRIWSQEYQSINAILSAYWHELVAIRYESETENDPFFEILNILAKKWRNAKESINLPTQLPKYINAIAQQRATNVVL